MKSQPSAAEPLPTSQCAPSCAGVTVGLVNTHYAYLPIPEVIKAPRTVDPKGKMWNRLRASIGQPTFTGTQLDNLAQLTVDVSGL